MPNLHSKLKEFCLEALQERRHDYFVWIDETQGIFLYKSLNKHNKHWTPCDVQFEKEYWEYMKGKTTNDRHNPDWKRNFGQALARCCLKGKYIKRLKSMEKDYKIADYTVKVYEFQNYNGSTSGYSSASPTAGFTSGCSSASPIAGSTSGYSSASPTAGSPTSESGPFNLLGQNMPSTSGYNNNITPVVNELPSLSDQVPQGQTCSVDVNTIPMSVISAELIPQAIITCNEGQNLNILGSDCMPNSSNVNSVREVESAMHSIGNMPEDISIEERVTYYNENGDWCTQFTVLESYISACADAVISKPVESCVSTTEHPVPDNGTSLSVNTRNCLEGNISVSNAFTHVTYDKECPDFIMNESQETSTTSQPEQNSDSWERNIPVADLLPWLDISDSQRDAIFLDATATNTGGNLDIDLIDWILTDNEWTFNNTQTILPKL